MRRARDATEEDLDLVADIAARGFEGDPVMQWVMPDDAMRLDGLRLGFRGLAKSCLGEHSALQVVADSCVTMWRAPAWVPTPPDPNATPTPSPYAADVAERFRILGESLEQAHPHDRPHWYLNVIATLPSSRGQGLGAVALQSVLERCDAAGEPAYLESSNPRNMTLYRRHGFDDVADPVDLPDGPSLYPMWREPRSG